MSLSQLPDPLWSADKVADYFGVDKQTVIRWAKEEGLEGGKINHRWKFRQSAVYGFRDRKYAEGEQK